MPKEKIQNHAYLNSAVRTLASKCSHPFARNCAEMLDVFFEFETEVPKSYDWKFTSSKSLMEKLATIKNNDEWNRIYWRDFAETLQAFSVLSFYRQMGIIRPAIRALNTSEFLAGAVLARSALELSAWSISSTNIIRNTVGDLAANADPSEHRYMSDSLQALMIKMHWGTRLNTEHQELKQINITTILQKLAKHDSAEFLLPAYAYLCEATHPNIVGNSEYCRYPENFTELNDYTISITSAPSKLEPNELMEYTFSALGWSGVCLRNSMTQVRTTLEVIGEKLLGSNLHKEITYEQT